MVQLFCRFVSCCNGIKSRRRNSNPIVTLLNYVILKQILKATQNSFFLTIKTKTVSNVLFPFGMHLGPLGTVLDGDVNDYTYKSSLQIYRLHRGIDLLSQASKSYADDTTCQFSLEEDIALTCSTGVSLIHIHSMWER